MSENSDRSEGSDRVAAVHLIALGVSYNGAAFHGWQFQNAEMPTIQGCLESAVSSIANDRIRVTCAGRTDAGVHATNQIVNFATVAERPMKAWTYGVNALLPDSISVTAAVNVTEAFSARFSARARRYLYVLYNARIRPALIPDSFTWEHRLLDAQKMHDAAQSLCGEHDFTSYRAASCQSPTPIRNVISIAVRRHGDLVLVDVTANAFLHHMVRNIVGVLLDVGAGEKPNTWPGELLELKNRTMGGKTAAANGLYLIGVTYVPQVGLPEVTWPYFLAGLEPRDAIIC